MKKLLSAVLALTMGASAGIQAYAENKVTFTDISDEKYAWAKADIETMAQEGYINGYEDNTYRPDNQVTRLETIVLFARAMGSGRTENKEALQYALDSYEKRVEKLKLNFGTDEIAYLLYRGILTEEDLTTYLSSTKANKAMPRQEAAAIITKAMCAEKIAKSEVLTDMAYTDAGTISADYTQYVFYVSEQGIMNGMDDNKFNPSGMVLRSQIAAMLSRTVNKMNLYIETPFIDSIDYSKMNVTIVDLEGEKVETSYDENTKFYLNGTQASEKQFASGTTATFTYINNQTAFIDMKEIKPDKTIKAIYESSVANANGTVINLLDPVTQEKISYQLGSNPTLQAQDGAATQLRNFALDSYVEVEIANDRIIKMSIINKKSTITGAVVEDISIEDDLYLTISHDDEEYDGMKFKLNDEISVFKNNDTSTLAKIYKGDRIEITMEYGIITRLKATSNTKTYEGKINEISISANPVIKVNIDGEIQNFDILTTTTITSDGEEITLHDMRVGDVVKITTESGAVLKIDTTAPSVSAGEIKGMIEVINTSKGFIKVNGETIFCGDTATTVITASGEIKNMKALKEEMSVSVRCSQQNGAYTAQLIIIED